MIFHHLCRFPLVFLIHAMYLVFVSDISWQLSIRLTSTGMTAFSFLSVVSLINDHATSE